MTNYDNNGNEGFGNSWRKKTVQPEIVDPVMGIVLMFPNNQMAIHYQINKNKELDNYGQEQEAIVHEDERAAFVEMAKVNMGAVIMFENKQMMIHYQIDPNEEFDNYSQVEEQLGIEVQPGLLRVELPNIQLVWSDLSPHLLKSINAAQFRRTSYQRILKPSISPGGVLVMVRNVEDLASFRANLRNMERDYELRRTLSLPNYAEIKLGEEGIDTWRFQRRSPFTRKRLLTFLSIQRAIQGDQY